MRQQFKKQKFHMLPTKCTYVLGVVLRSNSDYLRIQH